MKCNTAFLSSKVGRRIFLLFVCCALGPIIALAFISFSQVMKQLYHESQMRLHQDSKTLGMSIVERLSFLEAELKLIAANINNSPKALIAAYLQAHDERIKKRFKGLALVTDFGNQQLTGRKILQSTSLTDHQTQHLAAGKTVVVVQHHDRSPAAIFMIAAVNPQNFVQGFLYAEINSGYLWRFADHETLPEYNELCVVDASNRIIYSTMSASSSFAEALTGIPDRQSAGSFEWHHNGLDYIASYWNVFLEYLFLVPHWKVVMCISKSAVFSPMDNFKRTFPLVMILSLMVVALLSNIQIRKSLIPLEKLQEGTRHIAMKKFDARVALSSGDEFEDLAESFNYMAANLEKLFNALTTRAEIDRGILSSLDTEAIIHTMLADLKEFFSSDLVSVALLDLNAPTMIRTYVPGAKSTEHNDMVVTEITSEEKQRLIANPERLLLKADENLPSYLGPFSGYIIQKFMIIPFFLKQQLGGMITLGYHNAAAPVSDDMIQARHLADQMAVALSNANLLKELEELNLGTLKALARAVDAKSPWTAGHSERVTVIALKIADQLGLAAQEREELQRGGLLHDIGKIGIPAEILDKPERLTFEEYLKIKEHPRTGARILEPVKTYADIIDLVLQHHERFDGKGYPDGRAGADISLGARILSVADVFDALVSDRPYRPAVDRESALKIIKQESGKQFDPDIVEAFLKAIELKNFEEGLQT